MGTQKNSLNETFLVPTTYVKTGQLENIHKCMVKSFAYLDLCYFVISSFKDVL